MELFNEDRLAHPHIPHVFVVPRLMTHLWRKQLGKDANLMFHVKPGACFWPKSMHEPLYVAIVLPLAYAEQHRGPWVLHGSRTSLELSQSLVSGFKDPELYGSQKFHDLEGTMPCLRKGPEAWHRDLLWQFLTSQRSFPPVSRCLVRRVLPQTSPGPVPGPNPARRRNRRRRRNGHRGGSSAAVPPRKKRQSSDGDPL